MTEKYNSERPLRIEPYREAGITDAVNAFVEQHRLLDGGTLTKSMVEQWLEQFDDHQKESAQYALESTVLFDFNDLPEK